MKEWWRSRPPSSRQDTVEDVLSGLRQTNLFHNFEKNECKVLVLLMSPFLTAPVSVNLCLTEGLHWKPMGMVTHCGSPFPPVKIRFFYGGPSGITFQLLPSRFVRPPFSQIERCRKFSSPKAIRIALASSVTGALAAQSVLIGVGVGDVKATILGASLSWMLKDGSGMIGKIVFVGWQGLLADIINDCALFLELASSFFPSVFTFIICVANLCKSVVSVAGGATRAAVTLHQALDNNVADVAAKDGSQETLSNLLALFFNLSVVYFVTGNWSVIWTGFIILTFIHVYANYRAVQCLRLSTFNRNRFHIAVQQWLRQRLFHGPSVSESTAIPFPSIEWVNSREPILFPASNARIHLGCSLQTLPNKEQYNLKDLINVFSQEKYLLYCPNWRATSH
ncbi:hypothetical protein X801_05747, partial [Opisthorchis viverrini]